MGYDCFLVAQLFFWGGGRMLLRGFVFQMTWTALTFSLWNRRVGDVGFKNRYYVGDIAFRYLKNYLQRLVTSRQFKIKHLRFWVVVSKICFFHPWGNDPTYSTSFRVRAVRFFTGWILEPGKVETSKLAYLPTWDGVIFVANVGSAHLFGPRFRILRLGWDFLVVPSIFGSSYFDASGEQLSNEADCCLGFVGDHTTQLYRDYNGSLKGSLLRNQYNGK